MRSYHAKTVVVTGAAGGMGQAICRRFGRAGARLGLLDLNLAGAEQLAAELAQSNIDAVAVACDVTSFESCRNAMTQIRSHWGAIDVLVANAGITHRSALSETRVEVLRKVMEVNYFGAVNCTRAALEALVAARGQIVVISSIAGFAPLYGRAGYAASKHALHGFFDTARTELAQLGIGVTIVCPGFTATGIAGAALDAHGRLTEHPQSTLGRIATPEEVADRLLRAAARDKRLLVLSTVGRLTRLLTRIAPGLYEKLMARALRRELQR